MVALHDHTKYIANQLFLHKANLKQDNTCQLCGNYLETTLICFQIAPGEGIVEKSPPLD